MRTWKNYRASERVRRRTLELVRREKDGQLSTEEAVELDRYLDLEAVERVGRPRRRRKAADASGVADRTRRPRRRRKAAGECASVEV